MAPKNPKIIQIQYTHYELVLESIVFLSDSQIIKHNYNK